MSHHRYRKAGEAARIAASASPLSRRTWLTRAAGIAGAGVVASILGERLWTAHGSASSADSLDADATLATVYATKSCGCCHGWMAHLKRNGFAVEVHYVADVTPYKIQYGVPPALWSCHTARIGRYTIEGHVPADVIRGLLNDAKDVAGLAVPGMPTGSPGMEGPDPQRYQIVAFTTTGETSVFATR